MGSVEIEAAWEAADSGRAELSRAGDSLRVPESWVAWR